MECLDKLPDKLLDSLFKSKRFIKEAQEKYGIHFSNKSGYKIDNIEKVLPYLYEILKDEQFFFNLNL